MRLRRRQLLHLRVNLLVRALPNHNYINILFDSHFYILDLNVNEHLALVLGLR